MNSFIGAVVGAAVGILLVSVVISAQCIINIRHHVSAIKSEVEVVSMATIAIKDKLESNCEEEVK
jgi:hypothetical protein